jgi:early secretory antigenic target protein ESAT-6
MSIIKVTAGQLETLSSTVNNRNEDIQNTLHTLRGEIFNVVGNDWQGQASGQFQALYEEWQTSAAKLQAALSGIGNLLNSAGQQYAQTESAIAGSMN